MYKVLDATASAATGTGKEVKVRGAHLHGLHFLIGLATSGLVSAATVRIEGSLNGDDWFTLGSSVLAGAELSQGTYMTAVDKPVEWIRHNLTNFSGAHISQVTVTAYVESTGNWGVMT